MSNVVLLVVLPFTGALAALLGKVTRFERLFSVLAVVALVGTAVLLALQYPVAIGGTQVVYELGGWAEPYGIGLYLNGLSWLSSSLVVLISLAVAIVSFADPKYRTSYFFFLLLLVAGMQIVVLTGDIFTMFVGFEIVAISAYVLIAFDRTDDGLLASLKYLILSSVGILFFLFGVFLVYRDFGSLSLAMIRRAADAREIADSTSIHFAVAALCVGIGVRTAFIPFHTWLPEAHAYAPHPISAVLSGVLIKVSFFAMMRILVTFRAAYLNDLLLWIGAVTALIAVVWALAQTDAKRLLAYHSISQMGYILAAFGTASAIATTAAFAHAVHHALFKSLLFLVAGTAISMTGSRDVYRMTPVGRRAPLLAAAFLVGALSIAGVPPFNGFASKQLISGALEGHPAYVLLWITAVGTTASFIKISRIVMPGPGREAVAGGEDAPESAPAQGVNPPEEAPRAPTYHPGVLVQLPAIVLALLCLATGLFARPIAQQLARLLVASPVGADPSAVPYSFFGLAKLAGALPPLLLGVALYLLMRTQPGKRVAHRVERVAPELRTVLLFFVAGLGLFALVAYL
ncbi:MAG: complex I subunit 5 family protein [bacterium]